MSSSETPEIRDDVQSIENIRRFVGGAERKMARYERFVQGGFKDSHDPETLRSGLEQELKPVETSLQQYLRDVQDDRVKQLLEALHLRIQKLRGFAEARLREMFPDETDSLPVGAASSNERVDSEERDSAELFSHLAEQIRQTAEELKNEIRSATDTDVLDELERRIYGENGEKKQAYELAETLRKNARDEKEKRNARSIFRGVVANYGGRDESNRGVIQRMIDSRRSMLLREQEARVDSGLEAEGVSESGFSAEKKPEEKLKRLSELGIRLNVAEKELGEAKRWVEKLEEVRKNLDTHGDSDTAPFGGAVYEELEKAQERCDSVQREYNLLKQEMEGQHPGEIEEPIPTPETFYEETPNPNESLHTSGLEEDLREGIEDAGVSGAAPQEQAGPTHDAPPQDEGVQDEDASAKQEQQGTETPDEEIGEGDTSAEAGEQERTEKEKEEAVSRSRNLRELAEAVGAFSSTETHDFSSVSRVIHSFDDESSRGSYFERYSLELFREDEIQAKAEEVLENIHATIPDTYGIYDKFQEFALSLAEENLKGRCLRNEDAVLFEFLSDEDISRPKSATDGDEFYDQFFRAFGFSGRVERDECKKRREVLRKFYHTDRGLGNHVVMARVNSIYTRIREYYTAQRENPEHENTQEQKRAVANAKNLDELKAVILKFGAVMYSGGRRVRAEEINGYIDGLFLFFKEDENRSHDVFEKIKTSGGGRISDGDAVRIRQEYAERIVNAEGSRTLTRNLGIRGKAAELIAAAVYDLALEEVRKEEMSASQEQAEPTHDAPPQDEGASARGEQEDEQKESAYETLMKNGIANVQSVEDLRTFLANQEDSVFSSVTFDAKQWSRERMVFTFDTARQYAGAWYRRAEEKTRRENMQIVWGEEFQRGFSGIPEAFGLRAKYMELMREDLEYIQPMKKLSDEVNVAAKAYVDSGGHWTNIQRLAGAKKEFREFFIQHELKQLLGEKYTGNPDEDRKTFQEMMTNGNAVEFQENMRELFRAQAVADLARVKYYESQKWTEKAKGKVREMFNVYNQLSWKGKIAVSLGVGSVALAGGLAGAVTAAVGLGVARTAFGAGASYAGFKGIFDAKRMNRYAREDEESAEKSIQDAIDAVNNLQGATLDAVQNISSKLEDTVQIADLKNFKDRSKENKKAERNAALLAGALMVAGFVIGKTAAAEVGELSRKVHDVAGVGVRPEGTNAGTVGQIKESFRTVWQTMRDKVSQTINAMSETSIGSQTIIDHTPNANEVAQELGDANKMHGTAADTTYAKKVLEGNVSESPAESFRREGMFPENVSEVVTTVSEGTTLEIKQGGGIIRSLEGFYQNNQGMNPEDARMAANREWIQFRRDHSNNPLLGSFLDRSLHAGDTFTVNAEGHIEGLQVSKGSAVVSLARQISGSGRPGAWDAIKDMSYEMVWKADKKYALPVRSSM